MKRLLTSLLVVCSAFATTVTGPLKTPSTTAPFSGTIVITPSSQWTNVSSQVVSRTPITVIVTAGTFSVNLEPTDTATNPTNPYYTFTFYPSGQKSYGLRYSVPTSSSALTIAQLPLLSTVPDPTYNFVTSNRAVSVASPLSGGGPLYTDITISCPTCATITGPKTQNDCLKFDGSGNIVAAGSPCGSGGGGGGDALTTNPLSQFALTTSAQLRSTLSDETGTGPAVFGTSPTITTPVISGHATIEGVTPTGATGTGNLVFHNAPTFVAPILGAATATSVNKLTITAPATSATLTVANGKTFQVNKSVTLDGADGMTYTFPSTSATIARTDAANTFTGNQTITGTLSAASTFDLTGTGPMVFELGDENGLLAAGGGFTTAWQGATGRSTSLILQMPTTDPSGNNRVPIWGNPVAGVAPFGGWANVAVRTGANTYSGSGRQDFSQVPTRPFQSDVFANLPATCSVGDKYYGTDSARDYTCTAVNTWAPAATPNAAGTGFVDRTGTNSASTRTLTGSGIIGVTNGGGGGNPVFSINQVAKDTGTTANAITATVSLASTVVDGTVLAVSPGADSTGAATLALNGGTAAPITYRTTRHCAVANSLPAIGTSSFGMPRVQNGAYKTRNAAGRH